MQAHGGAKFLAATSEEGERYLCEGKQMEERLFEEIPEVGCCEDVLVVP